VVENGVRRFLGVFEKKGKMGKKGKRAN